MSGVDVDYLPTMGEGDVAEKIGKNALCQARFLGKLASGYRPAVFHIHVADGTSFWRMWLYFEQERLTGRPVVVHIHGAQFQEFHDASSVNAQAVARMFRKADRVLVLFHRMKELAERWTEGQAKVEVLYNPVIVDDFRSEGPPEEQPPTVLMMGEIGARKGAFDLAAVIPRVLAEVPDARFRFGGNGEIEELERQVKELGVEAHVDVLGWVSGADKVAAFRAAHVYCLPSYNENLPVSILEAMAAGLPVVGTDVAGTPEEVLEGETGFLVQPGDKDALADRLIRLLRDSGLRDEMGQAGLSRAEQHFENEVVVERLVSIWRDCAYSRDS